MAISFVDSATGVSSASIPSHLDGDLVLVFAYRDGNTTPPSLASGFTNIASSGGNTNSSRISYAISDGTLTTTGTFTNATSVVVLVYRGVEPSSPIGGYGKGGAASTTISFPTVSMSQADGSSWVVGFAGHRSTNTSLETPPSGMSNRASVVDATDEAAGHDTNGGVSGWSTTTVSAEGTSSGYRTYTIELLAAYPAICLVGGTLVFKTLAEGADLKVYLNGGQLFARLSAIAGDKLATINASGILIGT